MQEMVRRKCVACRKLIVTEKLNINWWATILFLACMIKTLKTFMRIATACNNAHRSNTNWTIINFLYPNWIKKPSEIKFNFIISRHILWNGVEFSVLFWDVQKYSSTTMKFMKEFNVRKDICLQICWPFVVIYLDYFWVYQCWPSLSSFITLRCACFGHYANAKTAPGSWNHSKKM